MTINTNLTPNELKAALALVTSCLDAMGGSRPSDLQYDEHTWIDAGNLHAVGYSRHEAAGTLAALQDKGFVVLDGRDSYLTTSAWQYLDTVWPFN